MKFRFSISIKILLLILPLILLPVAIVGYFSVRASVERVNRLVRQEQMIKVKARAGQINDIFYYCRLDLDTIASLPVLEDYLHARFFRLEVEMEFNRDNIVRLFEDFIDRTPFYFQIRFIDHLGNELIRVRRDRKALPLASLGSEPFFRETIRLKPDGIHVSEISHDENRPGYLIHWARPIYTGWKDLGGVVAIDLDHEKIIELVKSIHIGEQGYAFLIDRQGRMIGHPHFQPFAFTLENYPTPSLKALIQAMVAGTGEWRSYEFEQVDKLAAFSTIPLMGWSLAVTIPSETFRQEAEAIRTRVVQIGTMTLLFAVLVVTVLSYYLLRPVRDLVAATNRVAAGDQIEEIPIKSTDELGDLTQAFNRMIRNLDRVRNELIRSEKLISLGRLSAGVAHEIRNPLNAMKGAIVYMQRRRSTDPLIREYTQLVQEEIDRLNSFVSEFLYFARQSVPKPILTDLNKIIAAAGTLFEEQARKLDIRLHYRLSPDLPPMAIDPHQIEQVLVNLLVNAMDAMPKGGDITISTRLKKSGGKKDHADRVRVTVIDNGIGITAENLKNVFDPFFSTKEDGTGLGLPLSLGIVESHGGAIKVTSRKGVGTAVAMTWPLVEERAQEEDRENEKTGIGG